MKYLFILLLAPISIFANFDGVYHGNFSSNGYECTFDADIVQNDNQSISINKWIKDCLVNGKPGMQVLLNPTTFTFLSENQVEVKMENDTSVYKVHDSLLSENEFQLQYQIIAEQKNTLIFDVIIYFKLEDNKFFTYKIKYYQNGHLYFEDRGLGYKKGY